MTEKFLIGLIICGLFGCPQQKNEPLVSKDAKEKAMENLHFISSDGNTAFQLILFNNDSVELLIGGGQEIISSLKKIPSASGVKYQTEDSLFFWTKGNEFIWGQKDSVLISGSLVSK